MKTIKRILKMANEMYHYDYLRLTELCQSIVDEYNGDKKVCRKIKILMFTAKLLRPFVWVGVLIGAIRAEWEFWDGIDRDEQAKEFIIEVKEDLDNYYEYDVHEKLEARIEANL